MDFEKAVQLFENSGKTCIIYKADGTVLEFEARGIRPLIETLTNDAAALEQATITDRVIGRAAALLCVYGKAKAVYGQTLSLGAFEVLERAGIKTAYGTMVDYIENRTRDGNCPMEMKVAHTAEPEEAFEIFGTFFREVIMKSEQVK